MPELVVELVDRLLVGERPEDAARDVAREELRAEEDETLSSNSVMSASPSRLRRNRPIAAPYRRSAGRSRSSGRCSRR